MIHGRSRVERRGSSEKALGCCFRAGEQQNRAHEKATRASSHSPQSIAIVPEFAATNTGDASDTLDGAPRPSPARKNAAVLRDVAPRPAGSNPARVSTVRTLGRSAGAALRRPQPTPSSRPRSGRRSPGRGSRAAPTCTAGSPFGYPRRMLGQGLIDARGEGRR